MTAQKPPTRHDYCINSYENPSWLPRIDSSSEEGDKRFIEIFDLFLWKGNWYNNQPRFVFRSSGSYNRRSSTADTARHLCCHAASQKETITSSCNPQTPQHKITTTRKTPRLTHTTNPNQQGVYQSHCGLAIYIKKYIKAKEELWKLKIFHHAKI